MQIWINFVFVLVLGSFLATCSQTNHYIVLEIAENATREEIRNAYHKQSLLSHPDKNPGDPNAQTRFIRISEAYTILRDPKRRAAYDALLRQQRRERWRKSERTFKSDQRRESTFPSGNPDGDQQRSYSSSGSDGEESAFSFEWQGRKISFAELQDLLRSWELESPDLRAALNVFHNFMENMSEPALRITMDKLIPDHVSDSWLERMAKRFARWVAFRAREAILWLLRQLAASGSDGPQGAGGQRGGRGSSGGSNEL